jgi:hypothetical protein
VERAEGGEAPPRRRAGAGVGAGRAPSDRRTRRPAPDLRKQTRRRGRFDARLPGTCVSAHRFLNRHQADCLERPERITGVRVCQRKPRRLVGLYRVAVGEIEEEQLARIDRKRHNITALEDRLIAEARYHRRLPHPVLADVPGVGGNPKRRPSSTSSRTTRRPGPEPPSRPEGVGTPRVRVRAREGKWRAPASGPVDRPPFGCAARGGRGWGAADPRHARPEIRPQTRSAPGVSMLPRVDHEAVLAPEKRPRRAMERTGIEPVTSGLQIQFGADQGWSRRVDAQRLRRSPPRSS